MKTIVEKTEKPILFSGEMVRAILSGEKWQTRRAMKPQPTIPDRFIAWCAWNEQWATADARELEINREVIDEWACPYGYRGVRLWVREAWKIDTWHDKTFTVQYRADNDYRQFNRMIQPMPRLTNGDSSCSWRPPIHMPRWASRITLEVTNVRVERLQNITDDDAIAEGVDAVSISDVPRQATWSRRQDFAQLWDKINAKRLPWNCNPWVWVVTFKLEN